ncbi:DUF2218 domain-containing protein [Frigidibacter sp. ROC022]|uniref:DUF2218 domain-containing protein n=1 Tax=Frigidibacter sp. ROC022 TaxID=2971796 RepID=UPI00215AFA43|nr:DUF2218 domain-containing protein [Frigidibacter sp. ROC022]MCR8724722.1 DUF2218 domain-containing protein [Frigidibacter sp. ROC022]
MPSRTATLTSDRASSYLQQLCKHFGHKVPVEFTPEAGEITLPFGGCTLRADGSTLTLTVSGAETDLDRLQKVIGDHLARFAFRETPVLDWQPSGAGQ